MSLRYRLVVLLAVACVIFCASTAFAQGSDNLNVRIALHTKGPFVPSKDFTSVCSWNPVDADMQECTTYTTAWSTNDFPGPDVYMVAGQGGTPGLLGVSFGIDYNGSAGVGIDPSFVVFTRCTDGLDFPNSGANGEFPAPGGGVRITWSTCQNTVVGASGVHSVVGAMYVYVYSADQLKITPNNNLSGGGSEFAVTDCTTSTVDILQFTAPGLIDNLGGRLDFGGGTGFTPCGVVNTEQTTWGKLKGKYSSGE